MKDSLHATSSEPETESLEELVSRMLRIYGVPFTDALSRRLAVETWARQLRRAALSNSSTEQETNAAPQEARGGAGDSTVAVSTPAVAAPPETPRADAIVDAYLEKCDRVFPDGSTGEDIERDLREPIRQLERELAEERGYLISCPWCGEKMGGQTVSSQMAHVISCGDRRIGEARSNLSASKPVWQPIATAPKDRNIILSDGEKVSEGGWISDVDMGADYEGQFGGCAGWWSVDCIQEPTHWMPLPPAAQTNPSSTGGHKP